MAILIMVVFGITLLYIVWLSLKALMKLAIYHAWRFGEFTDSRLIVESVSFSLFLVSAWFVCANLWLVLVCGLEASYLPFFAAKAYFVFLPVLCVLLIAVCKYMLSKMTVQNIGAREALSQNRPIPLLLVVVCMIAFVPIAKWTFQEASAKIAARSVKSDFRQLINAYSNGIGIHADISKLLEQNRNTPSELRTIIKSNRKLSWHIPAKETPDQYFEYPHVIFDLNTVLLTYHFKNCVFSLVGLCSLGWIIWALVLERKSKDASICMKAFNELLYSVAFSIISICVLSVEVVKLLFASSEDPFVVIPVLDFVLLILLFGFTFVLPFTYLTVSVFRSLSAPRRNTLLPYVLLLPCVILIGLWVFWCVTIPSLGWKALNPVYWKTYAKASSIASDEADLSRIWIGPYGQTDAMRHMLAEHYNTSSTVLASIAASDKLDDRLAAALALNPAISEKVVACMAGKENMKGEDLERAILARWNASCMVLSASLLRPDVEKNFSWKTRAICSSYDDTLCGRQLDDKSAERIKDSCELIRVSLAPTHIAGYTKNPAPGETRHDSAKFK